MAKNLQDKGKVAAQSASPDDFLATYRELRSEKRVLDSQNGVVRNIRKRMKAKGIDMAAFAIVEGLLKLEDEEAAMRLRNIGRQLFWLGSSIGKQMDLFGSDDVSGPTETSVLALREQDAEMVGFRSGAAGASIDENPYPAGSPFHVAFVKGWHDGQADLARGLTPKGKAKKAEEKPDPIRRRRRSRDGAGADI